MYQIGKTLYVTSDNIYFYCDNNALAIKNGDNKQYLPYSAISQIIMLTNTYLSVQSIYEFYEHDIIVSYISPYGKFLGQFTSSKSGNVLLRQKQFEMINSDKSLNFVRNIIGAKIYNQRWLLRYFAHHNSNKEHIYEIANNMTKHIKQVKNALSIDEVRIIEANAANQYFSCFDLILKINDENMLFQKRSRRPTENNFNAILSFAYTLLTNTCTSALFVRGLDAECGYLHTLRSGRNSLACDLIEDLRFFVDKFVLTIINRNELQSCDFTHDNFGIKLNDDGRKKFLKKWDDYLLSTEIQHILYDKKMKLKYVAYEQAMLLAQYIRGDIDDYPPFLMT